MEETIEMFRPIGPGEYDLLLENDFSSWPPRLEIQPIFYPVTNAQYADEINVKWNVPQSGVGYTTCFLVKRAFADQYEIQRVGGDSHEEWWIPAEDLSELNRNLVGKIEVIRTFDRKEVNNESN